MTTLMYKTYMSWQADASDKVRCDLARHHYNALNR